MIPVKIGISTRPGPAIRRYAGWRETPRKPGRSRAWQFPNLGKGPPARGLGKESLPRRRSRPAPDTRSASTDRLAFAFRRSSRAMATDLCAGMWRQAEKAWKGQCTEKGCGRERKAEIENRKRAFVRPAQQQRGLQRDAAESDAQAH